VLTQITPNLYIELDGLRFVRFAKNDTQAKLIFTDSSPVQQIDLFNDEVVEFKRFLENRTSIPRRSKPQPSPGDDALPKIPKPPKVEVSKYGEN
jgi:hypothetical protein